MPGALLWGYYLTDKKWIPLQVDANGYVKVDLSNVNLDDLADVNAPTPADTEALVWDAATSKWIPGAAAAFDPFAQYLTFIPWVSKDGLIVGGDTGYIVTTQLAAMTIQTGIVANYNAFARSEGTFRNLYESGKAFIVEFIILNIRSIEDQNIWLRMARSYSSPPTEIHDHFGWKVINADLYASNANGATQTITDTGVNLPSGAVRTRLKMVFTPGTDIKFYVNDTLVATHTTNLPVQTFYYLHFHIQTLVDTYRFVHLDRVLIQKEY